MKNTLILTMLAVAFLGSGVANAAGTLYPKDYTGGAIKLGGPQDYDKLVLDAPLTLTGDKGSLFLYGGATIEFQKEKAAEAICSIFTTEQLRRATDNPVSFRGNGPVYNFTFDDGAQAIVAASAGKTITLIHDITKDSVGFGFDGSLSPSNTTLLLNGVGAGGYNKPVVLGGVSFTYVGPKADDYTFQEGEIGFTGYYQGSHALNLVVGNATPTPEPTTGTLSLLALAGLCARRRRK